MFLGGAHDEEGRLQREMGVLLEVDAAAFHHVEGAAFNGNFVEHVHIVCFAISEVDEGEDRSMQIEPCVHCAGALMPAELQPLEQNQT